MSRFLLVFGVILSQVLAGCGSGARVQHLATVDEIPTPPVMLAVHTVFLIVMENHNWADVKGSRSAPYINRTLLPRASHAEQYYNPPGNHPSLPNYLWLEAGTSFGIGDDRLPSSGQQETRRHLTTLLNRAGISWRAYEEGISGSECPLVTRGLYAPRHNPFVYFRDVSSNEAYCLKHERPYSELARDLARNTVARYNFITPDVCHDMHDSCPPSYDRIRQGDSWLAHEVPRILRSRAYRNGGALFITWDEGEGSDGPIGLIVLSPLAKGHGYADTRRYTHSALLRSLQEIFRVRPFLGDAAHSPDLRTLFKKGS